MLSITIDQKSISAVSAGQLDLDAVCNNLDLPESSETTKCVRVGEHGYVLSRAFQPGDALLAISLEPEGPLTRLSTTVRQEALGRLLRCTTLLVMGRQRAIPVSWRPFHYKNRLAFQADRLLRRADGGRINAGRIVLEMTQEAGPRVFAYHLDSDGGRDISTFHPNANLLLAAMSGVGKAIAQSEEAKAPDTLGNEVALDSSLPAKVTAHIYYDDWYALRLTSAQRRFVDHPLSTSVRLVGPAGSGKTVALVVKCLRELHRPLAGQVAPRFLFLTHASSTATGIENLVMSMDPDGGIELLASDRPSLV